MTDDALTPSALGSIVTRTLAIDVRGGGGGDATPEVDADGRRIYTALAYQYGATDTYGTTMAPGAMAHVTADDFRILEYHRADRDPVGKPLSVTETDAGPEVRFVFADTERARELRGLVDGGFLRAVSVGFIPQDGYVRADGVTVFTRADLHELSLVNTPASKGALISLARDLGAPQADLEAIFGDLPEEEPAAEETNACAHCGCDRSAHVTADDVVDAITARGLDQVLESVLAKWHDQSADELREAIEQADPELDEAVQAWIDETDEPAATVDADDNRTSRLLSRVRRHRR